jgi:Xaa-Pro aminopeptidase
MDFQLRIALLQSRLRRAGIGAFLVARPENRRYLSGYSGGDHGIDETSGVLLVPAKGQLCLLTDFRYQLQAQREVPWAETLLYRKGLIALLAELLPKLGVRRLAFESRYTLHATALKLADTLGKKGIETTAAKPWVEEMRAVKSEEEITRLRRAVRLNEEVFTEIFTNITTYQSEIEVALAVETAMRRKGAEKPSFATIVASGDNGALPHAVPGNRLLADDRPLTIDMGLVLDGYCSDMTRTFVFGKADDRYLQLHRLVRRAQLAGMAAIANGVRCCDVDRAARRVIADAGYGDYFGHSLGHGIGLAVHEEPRLSSRNRAKLKTGMVVTVEPGIYLPGWGGIRLENMVVVGDSGCDNLNSDTTWLDL